MNQRIKRHSRKHNHTEAVILNTGSTVQKQTPGDVPEKSKGLAKASPFFKKVNEKKQQTKAEQKKAIEENIISEPSSEQEEK